VDGTATDRAALARRAGPYRADGFPHPLDRRRLSGRVLAGSIAVVVLGALGLLTIVPSDGTGASGAGLSTAAEAAAAPVGRAAVEPSSWPAPDPTPATSLRPANPTVPPGSVRAGPIAPGGADSAPLADQAGTGRGLTGWLENRTAPECPRRWVAEVHVTVTGVQAAQVVATWFDGVDIQTISLRHRDQYWEGELAGLPVGMKLWWRAGATTADGVSVTTAEQPVSYTCAR
jgi:hypothetical protein